MIEVSKFLIRRQVLGQQEIRDIISGRFYEGFLAEIRDSAFPCINFAFRGGPFTSGFKDAPIPSMTIWYWSKVSREQAHQLAGLVTTALHKQRLQGHGVNVICIQNGSPVDLYDDTEGTYYAVTDWTVREFKS